MLSALMMNKSSPLARGCLLARFEADENRSGDGAFYAQNGKVEITGVSRVVVLRFCPTPGLPLVGVSAALIYLLQRRRRIALARHNIEAQQQKRMVSAFFRRRPGEIGQHEFRAPGEEFLMLLQKPRAI